MSGFPLFPSISFIGLLMAMKANFDLGTAVLVRFDVSIGRWLSSAISLGQSFDESSAEQSAQSLYLLNILKMSCFGYEQNIIPQPPVTLEMFRVPNFVGKV